MTFDSERALVDVLLVKPIQPELLLAIAPLLPPRLMPTAGLAFARLLLEQHALIVHPQLPTRLVEAAVDETRSLPIDDRAYVLALLGQRLHEPARDRVLADALALAEALPPGPLRTRAFRAVVGRDPAPDPAGESADVEHIAQMVQQVPIERRVDLVERFLDRLARRPACE
jgi:hypothetical protein